MNLYNLHMHTTYSDGQNTPEEMVREAIRLGLTKIGFSDHSFLTFDADYCMAYDRYQAYQDEIRALKEKFRDSIEILCGIEQDYFSDYPAEGFDYIIGSVHYILCGSEYVCIDFGGEQGAKILSDAADRYFRGDLYALMERYFETVADVVQTTGADLIGHFDIISKTNRAFSLFDPSNPRYVAAWKSAADRLLAEDVPFEINLSKIIGGYDAEPYPSEAIIQYLRENGARLICTGDSHSVTQLSAFAELAKERIL